MRRVYATPVALCRDGTHVQAKVYSNPETAELVVKLYIDGKHQKDADYFCPALVMGSTMAGLDDAERTAQSMVDTQVSNRWV